jgi:hypothetical protein
MKRNLANFLIIDEGVVWDLRDTVQGRILQEGYLGLVTLKFVSSRTGRSYGGKVP